MIRSASNPTTKSRTSPLSLVPSFFTVAVMAVFFELLSTEIFSGSSVVSRTPAGASSTAFPPLPLPGPWSSAATVDGRAITVAKAAVTSDPVTTVKRRELMFVPLASPWTAPEFAVLEEVPQDFPALCWYRPKCDRCVSAGALDEGGAAHCREIWGKRESRGPAGFRDSW